jgi:3-deoxy-manno-octulosonate cytidylyltransferase (CMP-KDO synthetase)
VPKKILGLIPIRYNSTRLRAKALLYIDNLPMIVHVYRRAKMSNLLNDVVVCCENKKVYEVLKKYNCKSIFTSKKHKNGTERIAEAYKKINKRYDLVVDIQGDEPLVSPIQINQVIKFHLKNLSSDIVVPSLKIPLIENENVVKIVKDINLNVLYFSRLKVPYGFRSKNKYLNKHLSIISFTPKALLRFANSKQTFLEKIEGVELLRALEIGLKIKSPNLLGDSFAVEVKRDYIKAKNYIKTDKFYKFYKQ